MGLKGSLSQSLLGPSMASPALSPPPLLTPLTPPPHQGWDPSFCFSCPRFIPPICTASCQQPPPCGWVSPGVGVPSDPRLSPQTPDCPLRPPNCPLTFPPHRHRALLRQVPALQPCGQRHRLEPRWDNTGEALGGRHGDVGLTWGLTNLPFCPAPRLEAAPTGAEDPGAAATERQ